jgi:hypothetical protein
LSLLRMRCVLFQMDFCIYFYAYHYHVGL